MRTLVLLGFACLTGFACDDGSSEADSSADAAPADAGPPVLPDLGVPPTCQELCTAYQTGCGEAVLLQTCGDCGDLARGVDGDEHPETYSRAVALCGAGQGCKAIAGCLSDNDGLTAVALGASVAIQGSAYDVDLDLLDQNAVVVLGTKNSGGPSDLIAYLTVDDALWRLEIDDLGADRDEAPLSADNNGVTLDSVDASVLLDSGSIDIAAFEPTGRLSVRATLAPAERPDDRIEVQIDGTWAGQF